MECLPRSGSLEKSFPLVHAARLIYDVSRVNYGAYLHFVQKPYKVGIYGIAGSHVGIADNGEIGIVGSFRKGKGYAHFVIHGQ